MITLVLRRHCIALLLVVALLVTNEATDGQTQTHSPVDRSKPLELKLKEFGLADGPMWDGNQLIIPDVKGQKLVRYSPTKKQAKVISNLNGRFSASYFNHGRRFLSDNGKSQIAFLDGNEIRTVVSFDDMTPKSNNGRKAKSNKAYRPNDLVVDNYGGIYVTFTPQNQVVYVHPDGTKKVAIENIKTPNGIALSPDGSKLYVSSFVPKEVYKYQIRVPGSPNRPELFAKMDNGPERGADGMAMDRAGNVYCAGPSDIWIWAPDGKLLDKIACPTKPINCAFMERDMRTLAITGLGGVYFQRMKISGVEPQRGFVALKPKGTKSNLTKNIPSTQIEKYKIGKSQLDVVFAKYGTRELLMDVFSPQVDANTTKPLSPCIVLVHGGGWKNGDKKKFRALALELCQRGFVTAAIEYRLADEARFPAAIHDCNAAVRFLRKNANGFDIDPNQIFAAGGSAGGHLVGLMASGAHNPKLQGDGGSNGVTSKLAAAIVMAGPMQIATGSVAERSSKPESNAFRWIGGSIEDNPGGYHLADAMEQIDENTCPILFMTGEHDLPQRNQPSRDKLKSLGIQTGIKVYADGKHGCWNRDPWFSDMVDDMDKFFRSHAKK